MKRKNAHNYKNLQYIPTWKLQEILDSPNCTGKDNRDYGPVKHELEQILWERQQNQAVLLTLSKTVSECRSTKEVKVEEGESHFPIVECWILPNGSLLAIPPVILEFEEAV